MYCLGIWGKRQIYLIMINVIFFVTFCIVQSFVLSMCEICNGSYIQLDFCFTYELYSVPNIIGVIYATRTMGAVRINIKKRINSYLIFNPLLSRHSFSKIGSRGSPEAIFVREFSTSCLRERERERERERGRGRERKCV